MNFFRSNVGTLNEILFEKKNKLYGAYAIRAAYGGTVFKSLGITAAIMIGGVWLLSVAMRVEDELVIKNDDSQLTDSVIIYDGTPPPKVEPPPTCPPLHSPPAGGLAVNNVITQIIDHGADTSRDVTVNTNIEPTNPGNIPGPGTETTTTTYTPTVPTNTTSITGDPPVDIPDTYPEFPGLKRFWADNIRYPEAAQQGNVEGRVWVNFVVDEKGKVISYKIVKKLGHGCDEEVLRVMKLMPSWKPGIKDGKPVKVNLNQPIEFRLQ